jgi:hypothetical protein
MSKVKVATIDTESLRKRAIDLGIESEVGELSPDASIALAEVQITEMKMELNKCARSCRTYLAMLDQDENSGEALAVSMNTLERIRKMKAHLESELESLKSKKDSKECE